MSRDSDVFADALAYGAEEREAFLDRACVGDKPLRARIDALLAGHVGASALLPPPPESRRVFSHEERPGLAIGHYTLREQIGEGGCGTVWVADQQEPVRRRVALKVIKLGMDTREVIARFEAERQALALMDHPHIARVFDGGTTEAGRPFFVMELVRGIPITKYCDENQLTPTWRLELFMKVCHAVQHAHQKGIIHRDLKPSNILVTVNDGAPMPKIIDFGIAKATQGKLTEATVYTAFAQFIGTPVYMSPEQAEMSSLDIDTRSDIYSLGIVLYELLTGGPPLDPKTLARAGIDAIRQHIAHAAPPPPSVRWRTLGDAERTTLARLRSTAPSQLSVMLRGDLDWIVMRCIEKDRTRRYETASGIAADIRRYLQHEPVLARPPSARYRAGKFLRRHRIGLAAAGAIAAVVVMAAMVSIWLAVRATRADAAAQQARSEAEKLVTFLLAEFHEEIAPTGRASMVAKLGRQVVDYYDGLPAALRSSQTERSRALALARHGSALALQSDAAKAKPFLVEAIAVLAKPEHATDADDMALVASSLAKRRLAGILGSTVRGAESTAFIQRAVAELRPRATSATASRQLRREFGELLSLLGEFQSERYPDTTKPLDALDEAARIFDELGGKDGPDLDVAAAYAQTTLRAAEVAQAADLWERSEELAAEMSAVAERVLSERPGYLRALETIARDKGLQVRFLFRRHLDNDIRRKAIEEEVSAWKRYLQHDPSHALAWASLVTAMAAHAGILVEEGRLSEAREGLAAALALEPRLVGEREKARATRPWWGQAALVAALVGDRADAERCLNRMQRAIEVLVRDVPVEPPEHSFMWEDYEHARRQVWERLGDFAAEYESANATLRRLPAFAPGTDSGKRGLLARLEQSREDLGYAAFRLGRYDEAETIFRDGVARNPKTLWWQTMLALTRCRQGRAAEARDFEQAFNQLRHPRAAERRAVSMWIRRNYVRELYVMALIQPDDDAGRVRRREFLRQAEELCDAQTDEVRQTGYWRELINRIEEEWSKITLHRK